MIITKFSFKFLGCLVAITAAVLSAGQASAAAILTSSSGGTTIAVTDNGAGDIDPNVGVVLTNGAIGDWNVSVSTGLTKPVAGSSNFATVDLAQVALSTFGASDALTVSFWDFDFTNSAATTVYAAIGGTAQNAIVSWQGCVDTGNGQTCTEEVISGTSSPASSIPNPFFDSNALALDGSFTANSFGVIATITPVDENATTLVSFDFQLQQVPLPAAAWLFGSAMAGLMVVGRRRRA